MVSLFLDFDPKANAPFVKDEASRFMPPVLSRNVLYFVPVENH